MMNNKMVKIIKNELSGAFGLNKIKTIIPRIFIDRINRAIISNTMEVDHVFENIRLDFRGPAEYCALLRTYAKIFGSKVFKIEFVQSMANANLFKTASNPKSKYSSRSIAEIPKSGVYTKVLDEKTIILVLITTEMKSTLNSEDEYISLCKVDITQYIIGGNRKKWKSKIVSLNDKHLKEIDEERMFIPQNKRNMNNEPSPTINVSLISSSKNGPQTVTRRTIRPMNTIVFPEKDEILEKIQNFMDGSELYYKTSIPYKIGILLHGNHGTGKTSFALALAHKYNIPISMLDLSFFDDGDPDLGVLDDALISRPPLLTTRNQYAYSSYTQPFISHYGAGEAIEASYRIILIDEIDAQLTSDDINMSTDKGTKVVAKRLLRLLNALDSIGNGAIVIATTNHIDCLTPKLIRSGRFDYLYELNDLDESYCRDMIVSRGISEPDKLLKGKTFPYNPSELEQDLIEYIIKEHKLCNTHKIDINELMSDELTDSELEEVSQSTVDDDLEKHDQSSSDYFLDDTDDLDNDLENLKFVYSLDI